MIEIVGLIQQLHISETYKEDEARYAIKGTENDPNTGDQHENEREIHPASMQWSHPFKSQIAKIVFGLNV